MCIILACRQVRLAERFRWVATHGVEDDEILNGFTEDLQIKIKSHVCSDLLKEVSFCIFFLPRSIIFMRLLNVCKFDVLLVKNISHFCIS